MFVGIRQPAVVPHGANGGVQRGVTPLAHWGVFSMSEAVREENALMSYGFLFPKACGGVGGDVGEHWLPFLFANNIGFHLSVGRTEVRPTNLRMAIFTSVAFPADLLRGEKALNC